MLRQVTLLGAVAYAQAGTNEEGKAFLAEKAKDPEVTVLDSGLMCDAACRPERCAAGRC